MLTIGTRKKSQTCRQDSPKARHIVATGGWERQAHTRKPMMVVMVVPAGLTHGKAHIEYRQAYENTTQGCTTRVVVPAGLTQGQARSDNSGEALRDGCHSKRNSNLEVVDGTYSTKVWQQRGVATLRDSKSGSNLKKLWMAVRHLQAKNCGCGSKEGRDFSG